MCVDDWVWGTALNVPHPRVPCPLVGAWMKPGGERDNRGPWIQLALSTLAGGPRERFQVMNSQGGKALHLSDDKPLSETEHLRQLWLQRMTGSGTNSVFNLLPICHGWKSLIDFQSRFPVEAGSVYPRPYSETMEVTTEVTTRVTSGAYCWKYRKSSPCVPQLKYMKDVIILF